MRLLRDSVIALMIGVVWAIVVVEAVGFFAATDPGRSPEMDALARGDATTFIVVALLRDSALYAIPSLFVGYLVTRLMTRPLLFAFVAGAPAFLFSAYSVGRVVLEGGFADARGVYAVLNCLLVLVAIP